MKIKTPKGTETTPLMRWYDRVEVIARELLRGGETAVAECLDAKVWRIHHDSGLTAEEAASSLLWDFEPRAEVQ